jgi:hypothetical protein
MYARVYRGRAELRRGRPRAPSGWTSTAGCHLAEGHPRFWLCRAQPLLVAMMMTVMMTMSRSGADG